MKNEFGIDVSRYQGNCNWGVIKNYGVKYAGIRTAISWAYVDPQAEKNIKEAMAQDIYVMPYWVLYPNEDPKKQVDNVMNTLTKFGVNIKKILTVVDVELYSGVHACTPAKYQNTLSNALVYSASLTGIKPMIYSRANFIDYYVTGGLLKTPPSWLNNYNYWLAQYLSSGIEHPGPAKLPKGVSLDRFIIHQTTDKGKPFGVESAALDYDSWQLNLSVNNYFDAVGCNNIVVPEPLTLEQRVAKLEEEVALLKSQN
jgi:GH25 family lysozyme M1 (1,4-beta-N-acetylmuramidase)